VRPLGLALALLLLTAVPAGAAPRLQPIGGSFANPVAIASPPGDPARIMVVEQAGTIRLIKGGVRSATPFLDLSAITLSGGERGLLSVAFPPDYARTGLFYVYLTAKAAAASSGDGEIQIREYRRADADRADPASGRVVLAIPHNQFSNHNGGQLQFGPDGMLWIGTGDGGNRDDTLGNAQRTDTRLGKLLRIDPRQSGTARYTVPADNPFRAGAAPEVWSYGLRNPWRFSFDRRTGDLHIGDVGQDHWEEIDLARRASGLGRGVNYGWPCREGDHAWNNCIAPGAVGPVVEQSHDAGWRAIIGGYVVRDPGLPTLAGRYLYGDNAQPVLRSMTPGDRASDAATGLRVPGLTAFGEDSCGRIYTAALGGTVAQLVDGPSPCAGAPPPPKDATPCAVSVRATGTRRVTRRRWLGLRVRSNEACRLTITGRVPGVARFRTLRRSVPAGRTVALKLRLTRHANRRLARAVRGSRSRQARLRVRSVDAAGNAKVITRRVRVRR
jgi:glucose/arabinose dehydrogenase